MSALGQNRRDAQKQKDEALFLFFDRGRLQVHLDALRQLGEMDALRFSDRLVIRGLLSDLEKVYDALKVDE